jgi:hypothetical protein
MNVLLRAAAAPLAKRPRRAREDSQTVELAGLSRNPYWR